jgi:hypothetical protein
MSAEMLFTDTIRAHAKSFAAFAVSLVFTVAALPALAQQEVLKLWPEPLLSSADK